MTDIDETQQDARYLTPEQRNGLADGWDEGIQLFDHAEFMDAELERVTRERDDLRGALSDAYDRMYPWKDQALSDYVYALLLESKGKDD